MVEFVVYDRGPIHTYVDALPLETLDQRRYGHHWISITPAVDEDEEKVVEVSLAINDATCTAIATFSVALDTQLGRLALGVHDGDTPHEPLVDYLQDDPLTADVMRRFLALCAVKVAELREAVCQQEE